MSADRNHLVVADDEPEFRGFVREVAERRNWHVTECANGNEVVTELSSEKKPSLVVLDLMMPEFDGVEVLRWLNANNNLVPVCVVTGGTGVHTTLASAIQLSKKLSVRRTLLKPVKVKELSDVIDWVDF